MPQPHLFAAGPASKSRARAVPKPAVTVYGYARVSTGGQSVDAQARHLRAAGAGKVFREVASGVAVDRPQLRQLLFEVAAGDVVMVTRLDRLARSTRDLLNTLAAITEKKGGLPLARRRVGRHHHGARPPYANRPRRPCRVRTRAFPHPPGEGRARAKANGISLGRKPKLTPHQKEGYSPAR